MEKKTHPPHTQIPKVKIQCVENRALKTSQNTQKHFLGETWHFLSGQRHSPQEAITRRAQPASGSRATTAQSRYGPVLPTGETETDNPGAGRAAKGGRASLWAPGPSRPPCSRARSLTGAAWGDGDDRRVRPTRASSLRGHCGLICGNVGQKLVRTVPRRAGKGRAGLHLPAASL